MFRSARNGSPKVFGKAGSGEFLRTVCFQCFLLISEHTGSVCISHLIRPLNDI